MASKYRKKFSLPEGAYQILEDYTREVLRDQPKDILEFSYLYFKALEEGKIDEFDYQKKGDSIPPPKLKPEERQQLLDEQNGYNGQGPAMNGQNEYGDEQDEQDYDGQDDGQDGGRQDDDLDDQQYVDENGNIIPTDQYMQQQLQDEDEQNYGEENDYGGEQEEY